MQIDCYGFEATSQWFKRRTLDPYLIKRSEGEWEDKGQNLLIHQH